MVPVWQSRRDPADFPPRGDGGDERVTENRKLNLPLLRRIPAQIVPRVVLPLVAAALPLVLFYSSVRTLRELDEQRAIYLRHRVSLIVSRLESLEQAPAPEGLWEQFSGQEPYLSDLRILSRGEAAADLVPLWNGEELFRTRLSASAFRAWVPLHLNGGLHIAQIDLNPAAADFLLEHGRHNVIVASIGGLVLVILATYSLWAMRRTARYQVRQLELEHLAHIGKMSAVLAHEIRNPLGAIKGFVQLAAERTDAPTGKLLGRAVAEAERLEDLVKDLLAYGRPSAPQWREVRWSEIAAVVQGLAAHLIGNRPVRFTVSPADLAWSCDPALLEQALLNLVRNAVEAIPPNEAGDVSVTAESNATGVTVRVRDTGPGLPPAVRDRLYEPFLTTKASGTGLGLAITRRVVVSLGGTLEFASALQGGVEAVLRFPNSKREDHA
jgi:two-component system sensor histidine kinase HydH